VGCSTNDKCTGHDCVFITSGGGFSKVFPTPDWQSADVAAFLGQSKNNFGPGFNNKGRAYPDISLLGHSYPVYEGGVGYLLDGTSASAPVFAAMISLVNAARLAAGKSSVGFANPAIYALAKSNPEGANSC
jgi:tripeptidyl-peptidase-1